MDSMQKELENWKEQNKKYHLALKAEQRLVCCDLCISFLVINHYSLFLFVYNQSYFYLRYY